MNRFRKSETKRPAALPPWSPTPTSPTVLSPITPVSADVGRSHEAGTLLALPPESDFRTSLILPSLSRRFTILRNSAGEPLSSAQIRQRLAEHRSRVGSNIISEEEEDMMIDALEQMRDASSSSTPSDLLSQQHPSSLGSAALSSSSDYATFSDDNPHTPPSRNRNFSNASSALTISPNPRALGASTSGESGSLFSSNSSRLRDERQFRLASKTSDRSLQSTAHSSPAPSRTRDTSSRTLAAGATDVDAVTLSSSSSSAHTRLNNSSASLLPQNTASSTALPLHPSDSNLAGSAAVVAVDSQNQHEDPIPIALSTTPPPRPSTAQTMSTTASTSVTSLGTLITPSGMMRITPDLVGRMSTALERALDDIEREVSILREEEIKHPVSSTAVGQAHSDFPLNEDDDTVLAPYIAGPSRFPTSSPPSALRSAFDHPSHSLHSSQGSFSLPMSPAATAQFSSEPYARKMSASPVPRSEARVPGYVPGMHRPITPLGGSTSHSRSTSDVEDFLPSPIRSSANASGGELARSNTTTPRAASPTPISREALHNSLTARTLAASRNAAGGGGNSPIPISKMLSGSPSPSPNASTQDLAAAAAAGPTRPAHEKSPSSSSLGPSNGLSNSVGSSFSTPRRSTSPAIELGSMRNRPAPGPSILRSRSPDNAPNSPYSPYSSSSPLDRSYSSRLAAGTPTPEQSIAYSSHLNGSPASGWTRPVTPPARAVSPAMSAFGRAALPSPTGKTFSLGSSVSGSNGMGERAPPSARELAMRSGSPGISDTNLPPRSTTPQSARPPGHAHASSLTSNFSTYGREFNERNYGYSSSSSTASPATTARNGSQHQHHRHQTQNSVASSATASRQLMFSPMFNSSRSSLESTGSSYHSWREAESGSLQALYDYEDAQEQERDRESQTAVDTSTSSGNSGASRTTTLSSSDRTVVDELLNSEEILFKTTGLTKSDIAVIHNKLVDMALNKSRRGALVVAGNGNSNGRVESSDGKTSSIMESGSDGQADTVTYQPPGAAKTVPQSSDGESSQDQKQATRHPSNASKADALLRSVIHSISTPSSTPPPANGNGNIVGDSNGSHQSSPNAHGGAEPTSPSPKPPSTSSAPAVTQAQMTERKRALTDALFGELDFIKAEAKARGSPDSHRSPPTPSQQSQHQASTSTTALPNPEAPSASSVPQSRSATQTPFSASPSPSPSPSPPLTSREPSTPSLAKASADKLRMDVQRQAEEATAALKSPSTISFANDMRRKATKKVAPSSISNPRLMSSSTSIDAIPISPSMVSLQGGTPSTSTTSSSNFLPLNLSPLSLSPLSSVLSHLLSLLRRPHQHQLRLHQRLASEVSCRACGARPISKRRKLLKIHPLHLDVHRSCGVILLLASQPRPLQARPAC
ncbi:hypothetical protein DL93DRAFT_545473 [Clavulina sp. PMI_390]|nr:hypothetical protein DL93DRAFT_545473 [Clavulina sp. PMI_390]